MSLVLILFMFVLMFSMPTDVFAMGNITLTFDDVTDPRLEELSSVTDYDVLQIWHYSDGRWGNRMKTVSDGVIGGEIDRLEEEFVTKVGGIPTTINYPTAVRDALAAGKNITVHVQSSSASITTDRLLNYMDDPMKYLYATGPSSMQIRLWPILNYQLDGSGTPITYRDFAHVLTTDVPFVHWSAGLNGYSLYRPTGGRPFAEWASYTQYGQTSADNKIDPTMIYGNGFLDAGHTI